MPTLSPDVASPRILVLHAAPLVIHFDGQAHPIDVLDFATERQTLLDSFAKANRAVSVVVDTATTDVLQTRLTLGCRVLHFSGHGAHTALAFEDGRGAAQPVSADQLEVIFASANAKATQLVFVSACHSQISAETFADAGVPHVVAVHLATPVYDLSAQVFARAFYLSLLVGNTVRQAFEAGRAAVQANPDLQRMNANTRERDKFILLPKDGDHEVSLFADGDAGAFRDDSPPVPPMREFPTRPEHFTGRNADMQRAVASVLGGRMTTLHGFPGIGKTALAIETAHYLNERRAFADGCAYVSLRGIATADGLRARLAGALGIRAENDAQVREHLADKRLLLVLDNCEDPSAYAAMDLREFLGNIFRAGGVKALLTSRNLVGAPQGVKEQPVAVLRLPLPDAARLFFAMAPDKAQLRRELKATDDQDALGKLAASELMRLLGGQPLALTLIAGSLANATVSEVTERVRARKAAAVVDENIPPDQRDQTTSLIASMEVSAEIVRRQSADALRLFAVMGLLPGGALPFDLDAIWGDGWREHMDVLVRHSVVQRDTFGQHDFYSTLPLITDFAARHLAPEGLAVFGPRATRHFAALGQSLYDDLRESRLTFGNVSELLRVEADNMAACLSPHRSAGIEAQGNAPTPIGDIGATLALLFLLTDRPHDGIASAGHAIARTSEIGDRAGQANVLVALGDLKVRVADLAGARVDYETALPIYRTIEDRLGEANVLQGLGNLALAEDDPHAAFQRYREAIAIQIEIENRLGVGACLVYMARAALAAGSFAQAAVLCDEALAVFRSIDDRFGQAIALNVQAGALWRLDLQLPALAAWWQSRDIFRAIGDERNVARVDDIFGQIQQAAGAQWPALEAQLSADAEAIRAAAVEALRRQLSDDQPNDAATP